MKKRKKTGGMFTASSGYDMMKHSGGGSGMGHATKHPQAKKKKKSGAYPSKPMGGY